MEKITVQLSVTAGGSVAERFEQSIETSGDHFAAAKTAVRRVGAAAVDWISYNTGRFGERAVPDNVPTTASIVVDLPGKRLRDGVLGEGRDTRQLLLGLVSVVSNNAEAKVEMLAEEVREHLRRAACNARA